MPLRKCPQNRGRTPIDSDGDATDYGIYHAGSASVIDSCTVILDGKPVNSGDGQGVIANAVAGEIQRLTRAPRDPLPAGEIAVLVRTNAQAQVVKQHLSAAGSKVAVMGFCMGGALTIAAAEADVMKQIDLSAHLRKGRNLFRLSA